MTTTFVYLYLIIGTLNYIRFCSSGGAMLTLPDSAKEGLVELAFFVLLWPVQLIFFVVVCIHEGLGWLLGKFFA
jgi:hypothetical protein